MKILYILLAVLLIGTVYFSNKLHQIEDELASQTNPSFNYIQFEMPDSLEFSKNLVASIHKNNLEEKAQKSIGVDYWFIFFYVGLAILSAMLLLKKMKIKRQWIYILVAALGVSAGICDVLENGYLSELLTDWRVAAGGGAVENAAFFAKIKFAIIIPLFGGIVLVALVRLFRSLRCVVFSDC